MPSLSIKTTPITLLQLLESLTTTLSTPAAPTTLIICTSKAEFLARLSHAIHISSTSSPSPSADDPPPTQKDNPEHLSTSIKPAHAFLTPTLNLLATSRMVDVVFCGSINALRAYITTFNFTLASLTSSQSTSPSQEPERRIMIVDVLALHHGTSEFTVQGLSRSFAGIAALASQGREVVLVECDVIGEEEGESRGVKLWDANVPLLNRSVKIAEPRVGGAWVGRKVGVRGVAGRWFDFVD